MIMVKIDHPYLRVGHHIAFLMRSSPMRITLMLSHSSCAESFVVSVVIISGGMALQIASNTMRSS
jgi:hypothetical protein